MERWFFRIFFGFMFSWNWFIFNTIVTKYESDDHIFYTLCILLIKIFPTTPKTHSNSSKIFSYNLIFSDTKLFNIQQLLHHKSKRHGTKAHAPLLIKSFPKIQRTQFAASSSRAFQRYKEHNLQHPRQELSKDTKNTICSILVWWIS